MNKKGLLRWGAALGAALIVTIAAAGHTDRDAAPDSGAAPPAVRDAAGNEDRVGRDCQVIQTMGFSRCGHSVTRRIAAPEGVIGADFAAAQDYYALWQIEAFSAEQIEMNREIPLYCPMHQVLSVNEAGEIVLTHNAYGDGMAVLKTYDGVSIGDFGEREQDQLLLGLGFDSREEADAWMAAH